MIKIALTEQDANYLIEKEKVITDEIVWNKKSDRDQIYEFIVNIDIDVPNTNLKLIVNRNEKIRKFSFTIVYNGNIRIKSLDIGKGHRNPPDKKENVGRKHKHTWSNEWGDQWAYKPDDITDDAPFDQVFWEFLKECNISFKGALPPLPPIQEELTFDDIELHGDEGVY